ncbi:hypothetical protein NC653_029743 [Populus alba x Populus x berolinensis]|uniref:Uncharacterized protein n=1 Tax=Populus alba x Populus x berolinensis TaxID=444605 RepID=A0AAD6M394_9ROSI|nr:hypothetical protein NC653_029743 [Populus alba x Populus x berolinensis]
MVLVPTLSQVDTWDITMASEEVVGSRPYGEADQEARNPSTTW